MLIKNISTKQIEHVSFTKIINNKQHVGFSGHFCLTSRGDKKKQTIKPISTRTENLAKLFEIKWQDWGKKQTVLHKDFMKDNSRRIARPQKK